MARTLIKINGMEAAKYQELPEHTKKMLLSQQKQALKLGAYFEVEDNELILYYPGLMPGEGLEQRVSLEQLNPRHFIPILHDVCKQLRIQWQPQYNRLCGMAEFLGLRLTMRSDEVVVTDTLNPKREMRYYYTAIGSPEYPGLSRLVADLGEWALLRAPHLQVTLEKTEVSVLE